MNFHLRRIFLSSCALLLIAAMNVTPAWAQDEAVPEVESVEAVSVAADDSTEQDLQAQFNDWFNANINYYLGKFLFFPIYKSPQHDEAGNALLDADGNPTTDPQKADLPTPLGGPKGSGLSLMFEMISGLMVGPSTLLSWITGESRRHQQAAVLAAIDIATFIDLEEYKAEAERLALAIKGLPKADGVDEILIPGERSDAIYQQRLRDGIPLPAATWEDVRKVAERFGVEMPATK